MNKLYKITNRIKWIIFIIFVLYTFLPMLGNVLMRSTELRDFAVPSYRLGYFPKDATYWSESGHLEGVEYKIGGYLYSLKGKSYYEIPSYILVGIVGISLVFTDLYEAKKKEKVNAVSKVYK